MPDASSSKHTQPKRGKRKRFHLTKQDKALGAFIDWYLLQVLYGQLPPPEGYTGLIRPLPAPITLPEPEPPAPLIRLDGEQGRLATGVHEAAGFRVWAVGRDLTRREAGSGVITRKGLWEHLRTFKIIYSKRHFNRLLAGGAGLFWHVAGDQIYLRGSGRVASALWARFQEQPNKLRGNLPGVRDVWIDPSGSLERFEAMVYAGWLAGRGVKHDLTIARETLQQLFRREPNTLRRWEQTRLEGIVITRTNFAQCPDFERYYDYIPPYAYTYKAKVIREDWTQGVEIHLRWQLPNTYHSTISTHAHRGQAAKVRRQVLSILPADKERGGYLRRRYWTTVTYKRRCRSAKFRMGLLGDVNRPVYVYLGDQSGTKHGIFEITNSGYVFTTTYEQIRRKRPRRRVKNRS